MEARAAAKARAAELLAGFPGALREAGLAVDPIRTATFLHAASVAPMRSLADLSRIGSVTLVGSHEDFPAYDAVFNAWFAQEPLPEIVQSPDEEQAPPGSRRRDRDAMREILEGEAAGKHASADEALGRKVFGRVERSGPCRAESDPARPWPTADIRSKEIRGVRDAARALTWRARRAPRAGRPARHCGCSRGCGRKGRAGCCCSSMSLAP